MNCWVAPLGIVEFAGVTAMDCSTAGVTVRLVMPVMAPEVAEIVVLLVPVAVARPAAVMVATEVLEEFLVTELVRFWVLPSL